jgi:spore coat polysaccharide biosynthesis protein SpsF
MEVGRLSKIGLVIQARMESSRLPGKALLPLPFSNGKPILLRIIKELQRLESNYQIIVATTSNKSDDIIETKCNEKDISCFRGSENNVLSRYIQIAKKYDFNHIVRLTADNPFICSQLIEMTVLHHLNMNSDYTSSKSLPIGMNIEVVRCESLIQSESLIKDDFDKEHVTTYIKREAGFIKSVIKFNAKFEKYRLTVDTANDFLLANFIASISDFSKMSGLKLIQFLHENYSWVLGANENIPQKNSQTIPIEEVKEAIRFLNEYCYSASAKILSDALQNHK